MVEADTVRIELKYSGVGAVAVAGGALATAALLWSMPLPQGLRIAIAAWIAVMAARAACGFAVGGDGRRARLVRVQRSGEIEVEAASGRRRQGLVRPGCFVAPWLTVVRWRAAGERRDRSVLILPDMAPREDFRRLRVLLRWS